MVRSFHIHIVVRCGVVPASCVIRSVFYRHIRPAIRSLTSDAAKTIRRLSLVVRTGASATRCCNCVVCRRICWGWFSLCWTLPLVYWPTQGAAAVTTSTSHRCCVNYFGCQFRDEWSSRLPAVCTSHWQSDDVPHCRHSTCRWAWSSFSPLDIQQDTRARRSTAPQQFRWQKLCCCGTTTHVKQFIGPTY